MHQILLGLTEVTSHVRPGFLEPSRHSSAPNGEDILYCEDAGLLTVAGTGGGKTTGHVIPTALTWPGSLVIVDPKGEIAAVTARRRREMGQQVVILAPFGGAAGPSINPLDLIDPASPAAIDDALGLATLLCGERSLRDDPYWEERGRAMIAGSILFAASHLRGEARRLPALRRMWAGGDTAIAHMLAAMRASPLYDGYLASVAEQFLSAPDRTRNSILSTVHNSLEFMMSPVGNRGLVGGFDFADIVEGRPTTIYLVLPPERLKSHAPLLRLWVGSLITAVIRRKVAPKHATLMLVDEAAQLGRMQLLLTAASLLRGYGLLLWTFWQSIGQIESLYGDDCQTLLDNAGALMMYGVANGANARRVAEATGWQGPLLDLPPDHQIVALRGRSPIRCRRIAYYQEARYAGLHDPNPYHRNCNTSEERQ